MAQTAIDTTNKFVVFASGDCVGMLNPPTGAITKADALLLAAYLVALSMSTEGEFVEVLEAVQNT